MQAVRVDLMVVLDDVDEHIMEIFRRHPTRWWKLHQIRTILEFEGLQVGNPELWSRLKALSLLSLIDREKRSRVYRYKNHQS
ncbi:MAG: hypothetical protein ACP5UV_06125 [Thermoplasmata archaeon]